MSKFDALIFDIRISHRPQKVRGLRKVTLKEFPVSVPGTLDHLKEEHPGEYSWDEYFEIWVKENTDLGWKWDSAFDCWVEYWWDDPVERYSPRSALEYKPEPRDGKSPIQRFMERVAQQNADEDGRYARIKEDIRNITTKTDIQSINGYLYLFDTEEQDEWRYEIRKRWKQIESMLSELIEYTGIEDGWQYDGHKWINDTEAQNAYMCLSGTWVRFPR